jgi:hypothetical protein
LKSTQILYFSKHHHQDAKGNAYSKKSNDKSSLTGDFVFLFKPAVSDFFGEPDDDGTTELVSCSMGPSFFFDYKE